MGLFGLKLSDFDPTFKKAKFGSVVRSAVSIVPGGSSVMKAVDTGSNLKKSLAAAKSKPAPPPPPKNTPAKQASLAAVQPSLSGLAKAKSNTPLLIGGGVAALAVVLLLVLKK